MSKKIREAMEMARYLGAAWKIRHEGNIGFRRSRRGKPSRVAGLPRIMEHVTGAKYALPCSGTLYIRQRDGSLRRVGNK